MICQPRKQDGQVPPRLTVFVTEDQSPSGTPGTLFP